jgi:SAM-dependent methyltransferase
MSTTEKTEIDQFVTSNPALRRANRQFYDRLWSSARLIDPQQFNTWPLIEPLIEGAGHRLEVGPGLRPRLPVQGTCFADISKHALDALKQDGGQVAEAPIEQLPWPDNHFDLVCALDIIEHVEDDRRAVSELARVAKPEAIVLLSTPLHPEYWTEFDNIVGHRRRYRPEELVDLLERHHLHIEHSAVFGMKPDSSPLLNLGMWFLKYHRRVAMFFYNRLFMPIGLKRQKPLELSTGLIPTDGVDEVFLVCRYTPSP